MPRRQWWMTESSVVPGGSQNNCRCEINALALRRQSLGQQDPDGAQIAWTRTMTWLRPDLPFMSPHVAVCQT